MGRAVDDRDEQNNAPDRANDDTNLSRAIVSEVFDTSVRHGPTIDDLQKIIDEITEKLDDLRKVIALLGSPIIRENYALNRAVVILENRRRRREVFDNDLFWEPAWDILLYLFIQGSKGMQVSISNACTASAAPATTALRWLSELETRGLVVRRNDEQDARRIFVALSELGRRLMNDYFTNS